jgi:hypothetical protein
VGNRRETQGQALAALGGAGLIASLWLPWYSFHIPQAALNSAVQTANQFGALGPIVRSGAQLLSQLGPIHVSAWHALNTTPAVLLVIGVIAGGLSALALTERAANVSQLTILAAIVGTLLVGYKIAVPPGQGDLVHPAWGIYFGLASTLAMLAGGVLGRTASAEPVPGVAAGSAVPSVAPPTP